MAEIIDKDKPEEPKELVMIITIKPQGCEVKFPLMFDAMTTYGMLKMAEKAIDIHYQRQNKSSIIPPKGSMLNFLRKH